MKDVFGNYVIQKIFEKSIINKENIFLINFLYNIIINLLL